MGGAQEGDTHDCKALTAEEKLQGLAESGAQRAN